MDNKKKLKGQSAAGRSGWLLLASLLPALALGASTRVEYDAAGRVAADVDANGNRTTYAYDKAGHRIASTDALGYTRSWAYDATGNLVSETDPLGHTTTYTLDELGHRIQVRYADGTTASTAYDALGRVTVQTDANQQATTFAYDALGHLVQVQDALGQVTAYGYDEQGRKVRQTDANGHPTVWTVDANGQVQTHTLPLGQVEAFRYDANGAVIAHTDFNGQVTTNAYDVNGRLAERRYADTGRTLTTYDAVGNRLRVDDTQVNAAGVADSTRTTYTYDARDRLLRQGNPDGSGLAYSYDANGNRLSVTALFPSGTSSPTTYTVDALNRVVSVAGPEGVSRYGYDADGRKTEERLANGVVTTWQYNARDTVLRLTSVSATGTVLRDDVYTVDALQRRTHIQEAGGRTTDYGYDALGRLVSEAQAGGASPAYSATYAYDALGNRTRLQRNGDTVTYAYDANDRLLTESSAANGTTTYAYDANGSLLQTQGGGRDGQFRYNPRLRLLQSSGATGATSYLYDADGTRLGKTTSTGQTVYLVDSSRAYSQVVAELDGNGQVRAQYTLDGGQRRLAQSSAQGFRFYLRDAHGSVRTLVDGAAMPTQAYDFDAFGNALATTVNPGEAANDYRYNGEAWDEEAGTYYLRARNYDPGMGRFTQKDSWDGREVHPLSLNHYIFADASPSNSLDPSGHQSAAEAESVSEQVSIQSVQTMSRVMSFEAAANDAVYAGQVALSSKQVGMLALAGLGAGTALYDMLSSKERREDPNRPISLYRVVEDPELASLYTCNCFSYGPSVFNKQFFHSEAEANLFARRMIFRVLNEPRYHMVVATISMELYRSLDHSAAEPDVGPIVTVPENLLGIFNIDMNRFGGWRYLGTYSQE